MTKYFFLMSSIEHRTFRGAFLGMISFVLTIVQSILLVPLFLTYWGDLPYGQFIAVFAFIQLLRAVDTGHQIYVGNKFVLQYHQDKQEAYKVLSSSLLIAFLIGFLELLVFILIWNISDARSFLGIQFADSPGLLAGILSMLIMWWLVGSVGGVLVKAVLAKGLYAESIVVGLVMKVMEIIVITLAVVQDATIGYVFLWLAIANFVSSIGVLYWVRIKMPEFYPWWYKADMKEGLRNFAKSTIFTLNSFLEQFSSSGLIFIITKFVGGAMVPVFTTIRTLANSMVSITNLLVQPLVPELLKLHSEKRTSKVFMVIKINWICTGVLVNSFFLLLTPWVEPLYIIWTKNNLGFDRALYFLLSGSVVMINYGKGIISYMFGINDLKAISVITYIRFILVFGISFSFMRALGLSAIGWGVLVSEVICSVLLPFFLFRKYVPAAEISIHKFAYSFFPILIFGAFTSLAYVFERMTSWICIIGFGMTLIIYYIQWMSIEFEVRSRIISMILRKSEK